MAYGIRIYTVMSIKNCKTYRIFGNSKFKNSNWLQCEKYFYVAYDGTCFDPNGLTICNWADEAPYAIMVSKEILDNYLVEVKL